MQDGYFRVSPDGQILTINPAAVGILGYENADEMVGRVSVVELYADSADRDGVLAELREHGEITGYEVDLKREDGTVVRVELTVAGVLDADGNLIAQDGTLRDVTERHRQAQELERSQQQVQSLVQNVPGAIYRYQEQDGAWVCTFMSDAIEEITGFPVEYFIGQSTDQFRDLVHPDDLTLFDGGVGNATDQDDGLRFEYRITARDGGIRWIGARGSDPVVEPDGQSYIDGSIYDATRAHEAELAGQRSDATFRHLFDSMADGYWVSTPAGAIQLCNPASVQILGYPDEQALKAINVTDLWAHPEQRNDFIAQLLEARSLDDYELDVRKYDGTPITLRCTFRLVGEGEAAKIEVTFRDITRQKQVDADIREARNAAEQANQAKSTFLANMSHELRTPLNAILGYSEMLIEEAEELEEDLFSDDLQKIHSAGTHLLALINDVLDLSKIEAGHTELFAENFTLEELIRDVSSTTAPLIEKNGNTLVVEVEDPQAAARQDLTKVRQALLNLLSNAGKFTDNGTVTLAARTETEESVSWMVLSVADTGIGVAEEKHQRLFEEFSQADASTTREYGGTGLGLAISRRFCRLMGGDITVASAVGEGSTFTIRIPLQLSDNSIAQSLTLQAPESAQRSPDSALPVNPGRTVLVIDDDPEACEIIAHHLKRDGFEVVVAHSGAEGLERAREIRPAAITLDVVMPEMDGWSVLSALKADDALHDIPVVMVSMVDDKTTGYTLGATSYLTKPVGREQLLESISRQLEATGEVLIVEDDANTRGMLARVLAKAGWTVAEAEDGQQGLAELEANTPQLILLDLMMPVMDGFEFLREVRARPEWRDVPVIVITAKDLTKADRRLLSDRVEQVLTKGVYSRDELIGVVRTALSRVATTDSSPVS
jgi:PAS domain S-box-containing protein